MKINDIPIYILCCIVTLCFSENTIAAQKEFASGLWGERFAHQDFKQPINHLISPSPLFSSSEQLSSPEISQEIKSVRWQGQIQIPKTGKYTFSYRVDDTVIVWIDGKKIFEQMQYEDRWHTVEAELESGWKDIRIDYRNTGGAAHLEINWQGPEMRQPQSLSDADFRIRPRKGMTPYQREFFDQSETGKHDRVPGLRAECFDNEKWEKPVLIQRERQINRPGIYPMPSGKLENLSVRWTGLLHIEKTGTYKFFSDSDDGLWLEIAGRRVITQPSHGNATGSIRLDKGVYPLRIDHRQGIGDLYARIMWEGPGFKKQLLSGDAIQTLRWKNMQDEKPMLIFLFYGHSNMDGRSKGIDTFNPRTWLWDSSRKSWRRIAEDNSPVGLLMKKLAEKYPDYQIGAVKVTQSAGTLADNFGNGKATYRKLVQEVSEARNHGKVAGVVTMIGWCEGAEHKGRPRSFAEDFAKMIDHLREDLDTPDLPFIVSQVEIGNPRKDEDPTWRTVEAAIAQLPEHRDGILVVPSNRHFIDTHHYNPKGYDVWTDEALKIIVNADLVTRSLQAKSVASTSVILDRPVQHDKDEIIAKVKAKIVEISKPRTPKELGTYKHSLMTIKFRVEETIDGKIDNGEFIGIAYAVRDRNPQPACQWKQNQVFALNLGSWLAQKELQALAMDDQLDDFRSPQYFIMSAQRDSEK